MTHTEELPRPDPSVTLESIRQLPKTDLHCHLDGSVRIDTVIDLAREQNVAIPSLDPAELSKHLVMEEGCRSLEQYIKAFDITLAVMQTREALERTAYELACDAADENVKYLEVRYSPILHTRKHMKLAEIVDSVLEGLHRAEREKDVKTGVIICGIRHIKSDLSLRLAELAVAYKDRGVVGFDLAGVEENFPAKEHQEAFQLVLDNNINCTLHAGEAFGPESIAQAIHRCGAHRIGHGTNLRKDGDLLNYVNDHRIPLEVCVSSNVHTRSVRRLEEHPLRLYYDYGLRVTINTDNRLMSNTSVSQELYRAATQFEFTMEDIKSIIVAGFKSSFLSYRDKVRLLKRVLPELGRYPVYPRPLP